MRRCSDAAPLYDAPAIKYVKRNKTIKNIGTPTISGIRESAFDYAVGLAGGVVYALSAAFTGSGLLGGLIGAGLAGSVVKGTRGTVIATVLGFQTIVGAASQANAAPSDNSQAVM